MVGALTLALMPAAAAQPAPAQIEGTVELIFPDPPDVPHWVYTLSGDIEGIARIDVPRMAFRGSVEHWEEVMTFDTSDGATIVAESRGVWDMTGLDYETHGIVVSVEGSGGAYDYLVGMDIHAKATLDSNIIVPGLTGVVTYRIR